MVRTVDGDIGFLALNETNRIGMSGGVHVRLEIRDDS